MNAHKNQKSRVSVGELRNSIVHAKEFSNRRMYLLGVYSNVLGDNQESS